MTETQTTDFPLQVTRTPSGALIALCDRENFYEELLAKFPDDIIFYVFVNSPAKVHHEYRNQYNTLIKEELPIQQFNVMKVVRTAVGFSTRTMNLDEESVPLGLADSPDFFSISLPRIPWTLLKRVEAFFREIDDKMHCESIVLLTFDESLGGADGWGVLVPKQENNGGHCDYNNESVMELKEPGVEIVGTIHSHPGMSAYASHTDHQDQQGADGVHITIGWRGTKGPAEYYCEFQQMGKNWEIQPGALFEPAEIPAGDDEVDKWVERVEYHHPKALGNSSTKSSSSTGGAGTFSSYAGIDPLRGGVWEYFRQHGKKQKDSGVDPAAAEKYPLEKYVYAAVLDHSMEFTDGPATGVCPFCAHNLIKADIETAMCGWCFNLLICESDVLNYDYGVVKATIKREAMADWVSARATHGLVGAPFSLSYRSQIARSKDMKGLVLFDLREHKKITERIVPSLEDVIEMYFPEGSYSKGEIPAPPASAAQTDVALRDDNDTGSRRPFGMWFGRVI